MFRWRHQWMKNYHQYFFMKKINFYSSKFFFVFISIMLMILVIIIIFLLFFILTVVERFTTNRASTIKSSTNTINMDHHTSAKQRLTHEQTLSMDDQMIRVRVLNSSEVYEGNDAILKCEFNRYNSLYEVAAWFRDDGKIYLPLERLVSSIRRTLSGGLSTSSSTSSSSSSSSSSLSSNTVHYGKFKTLFQSFLFLC